MKQANQHMKVLPIAFGIATLTLGTAAVFAADAPAKNPAAQATPQAFQIEEVIVTARKVEESQQVVPTSIVALSAKALEAGAVFNTQDLQAHVTGLVANTTPHTGFRRLAYGSRNRAGSPAVVSLPI